MRTRTVLVGCILATLLAGPLANGQERRTPQQRKKPVRTVETQRRQLENEKRRSDLRFNNEKRQIELKRQRMELNHREEMLRIQEYKAAARKQGWHGKDGKKSHCMAFALFFLVVHILLAGWVYQDIRRRNSGSGIWIVLTLLTGFLGALVYAIVRLGDKPASA